MSPASQEDLEKSVSTFAKKEQPIEFFAFALRMPYAKVREALLQMQKKGKVKVSEESVKWIGA